MKRAPSSVVAAGCAALLLYATPGHAADCTALLHAPFATLPDARTTISSAVDVPASADLPAHCQVRGLVAPAVHFEVRLPADWNGKFLHEGCGGLCGDLRPATCDDALARRSA
ncbi:MAG: hypothetical protein ABI661_07920, partial [Gammaproteobacteria bacterium]